jgi:hypothetical protein
MFAEMGRHRAGPFSLVPSGGEVPMIAIAPARLREVSFVAAHMREADRREIWCQWPDRDAAALA